MASIFTVLLCYTLHMTSSFNLTEYKEVLETYVLSSSVYTRVHESKPSGF